MPSQVSFLLVMLRLGYRVRHELQCWRPWFGKLFKLTAELEGNCFFSLTFANDQMEKGFVRTRHERLITGTWTCSQLLFLATLLPWVFSGFAWETSGGNFKLHEGEILTAVVVRNGVLISQISLAVAMFFVTKIPWCVSHMHVLFLDYYAASWLILVVVLWYGQSPVHLLKIFDPGQDAGATANDQKYMSERLNDLYLLIIMDAIVTASHAAMPVRWFLLVPMEMLVVVGYAALTFGVGGNSKKNGVGGNTPFYDMFLLIALIFPTSVYKRRNEILERESFARIIAERSMNVQVEHQLFHGVTANDPQLDAKRRDEDKRSSPDSVPTTNATAVIFQGVKAGDEDALKAKISQISQIGKSEHWLIEQEDVQADESRILGAGGFGVVMEGSYHGARVALKASLATKEMSWDLVVNELRVLRRLRHPNIVTFYGACLMEGTLDVVLVMELVHGALLQEYVPPPPAEGPPMQQRWQLAHDVCCALMYMHSQKPSIVHGDIKDNNMMVERNGDHVNVKLLDFGLARIVSKQAKLCGGTAAWQAPESMQQVKLATSADVFSCGKLLYKLATGSKPHAHLDGELVLKCALEGIDLHLDWMDVPQDHGFRIASDACTKRDPKERPSIFDLHESLRRLAEDSLGGQLGNWKAKEDARPSQVVHKLRQHLCVTRTTDHAGSSLAMSHSTIRDELSFSCGSRVQ